MRQIGAQRRRKHNFPDHTCRRAQQGFPDESEKFLYLSEWSMENGNYTVVRWRPSKKPGPSVTLKDRLIVLHSKQEGIKRFGVAHDYKILRKQYARKIL
jgi:hypothetical protein